MHITHRLQAVSCVLISVDMWQTLQGWFSACACAYYAQTTSCFVCPNKRRYVTNVARGRLRPELHKRPFFCAVRVCCVQRWMTSPIPNNSCVNHRKRTTQNKILCSSFSTAVQHNPLISAVEYYATALISCYPTSTSPCASPSVGRFLRSELRFIW